MVELSLKIVAPNTRSSQGNLFAVKNVDIVSCTPQQIRKGRRRDLSQVTRTELNGPVLSS